MKTQATLFFILCCLWLTACTTEEPREGQFLESRLISDVKTSLLEKFGEADSIRITRGVDCAAAIWIKSDGDADQFRDFCMKQFVPSGADLDLVFSILEQQYEVLNGHLREINLQFDYPVVTHQRTLTGIDRIFSKTKPSVDPYASKLAFAVALNFPHYSQDEKEVLGKEWSRKEWAMVRMGDLFSDRPDPEKKIEPLTEPEELREYHTLYILSMDHILSPEMEILFPEGTRLNCHNGLRDEIKGLYTRQNSLERQRMINQIMMHVIHQSIPVCMIGETQLYWKPDSNEVFKKENGQWIKTEFEPEADKRYRYLHYRMNSKLNDDLKYAEGSDYLSRTFEQRQLSKERVVELLESVVGAPERLEVAEILKERLGRDLEPFDIWYPGFQGQSNYNMDELDRIIREKYPTPAAFQQDLPNILRRLGFADSMAQFLGERVVVDPLPSAGHANGPQMRGAKAHLRTRFEPYGLNYKGYRIGMHEVGHTIEQNVAINFTDHYFLKGIPSSSFTECMADLIAYRDVVGLGVSRGYSTEERQLNALAAFWFVCELGSVALHEILVWEWFYANPGATVEELKKATLDLAKELWNKYFAEIYGVRDVELLAIYNHFLDAALYLHNYPLGNIILMQLEEYFEGRDFASEMVRMCAIGNLTPDLWMQQATGEALSSEPMLRAVRKALGNSLQ